MNGDSNLLCILSELAIVFDDFISVKNLVKDFVVWSWVFEEGIIHITTSSWIDSQEVSSSLVFNHCFSNVFLILKVGSLFHWLKQRCVLDWILLDKLVNILLQLMIALSAKDVLAAAHHSTWRYARSLNTIAKSRLLHPFIVKTFHPILDLVK
jgi:hypothetical protein